MSYAHHGHELGEPWSLSVDDWAFLKKVKFMTWTPNDEDVTPSEMKGLITEFHRRWPELKEMDDTDFKDNDTRDTLLQALRYNFIVVTGHVRGEQFM